MKKQKFPDHWLVRQIRPFLVPLLVILGLGIVSALCALRVILLSKALIDSVVDRSKPQVVYYAIVFVALVLVQLILEIVSHVITAKTQGQIENRIQQGMIERLALSRWGDFTRFHSGDLMTRITSDVRIVTDNILYLSTGLLTAGFRFLIAFIALYQFDPMLALATFLVSPVMILFSRIFGKRLKKSHLQIQSAESLCREKQTESLQNMLVVKTFQYEPRLNQEIDGLVKNRLRWQVKRAVLSAFGNAILSLGFWITYLMAFGWGAYRIYIGSGTFGMMTVFLQLVWQIQGPFVQMAYSYPKMISMFASMERIEEVEKLPIEPIEPRLESSPAIGIELENVSFSYRPEKTIFHQQSIRIEPGKMIGITGLSGEGKTTLIQLLLALLIPDEGKIWFTDVQGNRVPAGTGTRAYLAYVPQDNTLFSGTIEENLRIGNACATPETLMEVLKAVGAWDFIEPLPEGLKTHIGEKGFGLSEGQLQRISIARALLRKAPVLILDEATSGLDMDHEKQVLDAIRGLSYHPTCLMITHRPSALACCDQVWTVHQGVITEENI